MKVAILGDRNRASVWERHLRTLPEVEEVIITSSMAELEGVHACILLDDSDNNLESLSDSIRLGIHTYLVSSLPANEKKLKKIQSLSRESDVRVQFSHWPSLSPADQWMKQQIHKPGFIQVLKEQSYMKITGTPEQHAHHWRDEIGWIVKWMNIGTHKIEAKEILPGSPDAGNRIEIKFENGASASLFYFTAGEMNMHRRIASGGKLLLDNNVNERSVRKSAVDKEQKLSITTQRFFTKNSAELSAMLFLRAVRTKSSTAFTPYDALQTSRAIKKINDILL